MDNRTLKIKKLIYLFVGDLKLIALLSRPFIQQVSWPTCSKDYIHLYLEPLKNVV